MDPIREGMTGVAVEDVQDRLAALGYPIDKDERAAHSFGASTVEAVNRFRMEHDLPMGGEVDSPTWSAIVDEGFHMGDRTLYLRLPNYHGNDVRTLQNALNVLGFPCGDVDGYFGPRTEGAVKQFQENMGMLADGMCFQDTFQAVWRLYHVWGDKIGAVPELDDGSMGFARAASVLEDTSIAICADDPIGRTVASRIWNLASATSENSGLVLLNRASEADEAMDVVFELTCQSPTPEPGITNVIMDDAGEDLTRRIRTAHAASRHRPPYVRIQLPGDANYEGDFTANRAQMIAMVILDAICAAFVR